MDSENSKDTNEENDRRRSDAKKKETPVICSIDLADDKIIIE